MDWNLILTGATSALGGGTATALVGRILGYRKSREAALDERYQRLIDEQQQQIIAGDVRLSDALAANERLRARTDEVLRIQAAAAEQTAALLSQIATLQKQNATIQAAEIEAREGRRHMHERLAEMERRHASERAAAATRIAELEDQLSELLGQLSVYDAQAVESQTRIQELEAEVVRLSGILESNHITDDGGQHGGPADPATGA